MPVCVVRMRGLAVGTPGQVAGPRLGGAHVQAGGLCVPGYSRSRQGGLGSLTLSPPEESSVWTRRLQVNVHRKLPCDCLGHRGSSAVQIYTFPPPCPPPPRVHPPPQGGSLKRSARAVQLFGRLAVLETHTL